MQTRVRTTIILPEELLKNAKLTAVHRKKPLSLIVQEALEQKLFLKRREVKQDPLLVLGKYSLGIKSKLNRKDLYAEHIKHKISY